MSLFAASECSTSKNPLSKFSGHGLNTDNSLHRQQQHGQQQPFNQNSMVNERAMCAKDAQDYNNFVNYQSGTGPSAFNMQPIHRELININKGMNGAPLSSRSMTPSGSSRQFTTSSNWSQEFASQSSPSQHKSLTAHASPSSSSLGNAPYSQSPASTHFSPRYRNNFMFANSGAMHMHSRMSHLQPQQAQNQHNDQLGINWDDHFKDIEKEITSPGGKEKVQELNSETDEIVQEIKNELKHNVDQSFDEEDFNKTFEEVWGNVQQNDIDSDLFDNDGYAYDNTSFAENQNFNTTAFLGFDEYVFEENQSNQFANMPNPYDIGLQLMENGAKLSEAALAFEAAVQQNPKHVDAWLKLGEVQSANEKEKPGIVAYNQVLKLDPNNLTALMNSAIGYINEGYDSNAVVNLRNWVFNKYPSSKEVYETIGNEKTDLAASAAAGTVISDSNYLNRFQQLIDVFLTIIRTNNQSSMDPDLQLGLGVLFYGCGQFEKTIDCFKTALKIQPDNEVLWNRLGAALANSHRSEEAIDAYYKALQLRPSFVRARYNLGISCQNIGCYKEAAQHLLAGLSLHRIDGVPETANSEGTHPLYNISANQSNSLLDTLRRAFMSMDRKDLADKVKPDMDLNQFRNEFEF